jgi:serine/threonine protein kinase
MMVLEYATHGSLRDYLRVNYSTLKWADKLEILLNIINNLDFIHERNYIHKDLHSGNILQFYYKGWFDTKITDLGLAQLVDSNSPNSTAVCGVLPYIAPEILNGKPYSFESDIYSFGIIMVEISTGKPPYGNIPHDEQLAISICNGKRPTVAKGTPKCYIDLVNQCLDASPYRRPTSKEILNKIRYWRFCDDYEKHSSKKSFLKKNSNNSEYIKMFKDFIDADKFIPKESSLETTLHPEAIYTSRIMTFDNINESIGIQEGENIYDNDLI